MIGLSLHRLRRCVAVVLLVPVLALGQDAAELKKQADAGDAEARFGLGNVNARGEGVPPDFTQAVRWYRLAAVQGDVSAQFSLALRYARGEGVAQDYTQAVKWYRLAAEQGDDGSQFNLGVMYYHGRGVAQDYIQAHIWIDLSASAGHERAREARDELAEEMTVTQLAQAQQLAAEWKLKTASAK